MTQDARDHCLAPFLTDIAYRRQNVGVLVQARFHVDAFDQSTLPVSVPISLQHAVPKRRAEFLAGRVLARLGQMHLGLEPKPVGIAESRAPDWPNGVTGSISHSLGRVAVWVSADPGVLLGLDLESTLTRESLRAVQKRCVTAEELRIIGHDVFLMTAVFSAKETLFKTLYPQVGRFFGFDAAHVVSVSQTHVVLRLTGSLSDVFRSGHLFDISIEKHDGMALTKLVVRLEWP